MSELYKEEISFEIHPIIYIAKHFEIIKNQVDIYFQCKNLKDKGILNKYLKIIDQLEQLQAVCALNCYRNLDSFKQRLKSLLKKVIVASKFHKETDYLNNIQTIRRESIELRREILKHNFKFIDKMDTVDVGSLIVIKPFCLDDYQVKIIKY